MCHRRQTAFWLVLFTVLILAASAATAFAAPVNDNFSAATPITNNSGTITGTNSAATIETNEVRPEGNTRSIWYKYTATSNDVISFDTVGSLDPAPNPDEPLPVEVHVYTGTSVSNLVELPESSLPGDLLPNGHVVFPVTNTYQYYIAITSPPVAPQGNTVLNWQTKGYNGHITGAVTATNGGTQLGGIQVDAYLVGGNGKSLRTVTTNGSGIYDLMGLGTGDYKVRFTDPAPTTYLTEWYDDRLTEGSANPVGVVNGATTSGKNAILDRAVSISGNVKGNGANLQDVVVQLWPYTGNVLDTGGAISAQTNALGNYTFSGLRPKTGVGNYYIVQFVEPGASGFTEQFYNLQSDILLAAKLQPVEGTVLSGINCTWPTPSTTPGTLNGTVSSSVGGTLNDVAVTVSGAGSATTAGGGAYSIAGIPPGTYSVKYSMPGFDDQWATVTITSGATTTQDVTLVQTPGTLAGTVSSSLGGTLNAVTVSVPGTPTVNTAGAGGYSIAGITPGTYDVTYSLAGYNSQTVSVTITSGATTTRNVTLVKTPGALTGTVSSSLGGTLDGVTVSVPGTPTVNTAGGGAYSIAGITPNTYSVTYSLAGYTPKTVDNVKITSGATTTQNVTLDPLPPDATPVSVWRFRYEGAVGNYLWTSDPGERDTIKANLVGTWTFEGQSYWFDSANPVNKDTMWRFKNKYMWSYFYTADPGERAAIQADPNSIWEYEGATTIKIARTTPTAYPVYRFRCLSSPTYLWTADAGEMAKIRDTLQSEYELEGVSYWLGR